MRFEGSTVRIRTVLVSVLAIALFAWFVTHANLADVWVQVRRARLDLLVVGFLMVVLTYVIRAYRWQYLLRPIGPTRRFQAPSLASSGENAWSAYCSELQESAKAP